MEINQVSAVVLTHNLNYGGAATACRRLIHAFETNSVQVQPMTIVSLGAHESAKWQINRVRAATLSRIDALICRYLDRANPHWKSSGLLGQITAERIQKQRPNFVNIHWIGHATISLKELKKLEIPTIVTMHDEWWIEPVAHYSTSGILRTETGLRHKIRKSILQSKRSFLAKPNVNIVCLSNEMQLSIVEKFPELRHKVIVIANPVNSDTFFPIESHSSTRNRTIVLYAGGQTDERKGFDLLLEALKNCEASFQLYALGISDTWITGKYAQIRVVGHPKVSSELEMNEIYNLSELTLVPSRQEALPQVATESLMAGTPVLSFKVGGLIDVILDGITGYTVEKYDCLEYAHKIDYMLSRNTKELYRTSQFAQRMFSEESVAHKYLELIPSGLTTDLNK